MKRRLVLVTVIVFGLIYSTDLLAGEFFFDTVMDKTISATTPAKVVNLQGYKEFSLLARFEGPANARVSFEINNNNLRVIASAVPRFGISQGDTWGSSVSGETSPH